MLRLPLNANAITADKLARITRGLWLMNNMDEMRPAVQWLRDESVRLAIASCTELDDKVMRQIQGAHLVIDELLEKMDKAKEVRDRIDNR